jgi:ASCH domain
MSRRNSGTESSDSRVLSVRQPWAWAIVAGHKDVENRTWSTTYRGRVFIHASLKPAQEGFAFCNRLGVDPPTDLTGGAVIGSVEIYEVAEASSSPWWIRGNTAWLLRAPLMLVRPVPLKGKLGIFRPSPSDARRLRRGATATT